jgi:hypothetical protein
MGSSSLPPGKAATGSLPQLGQLSGGWLLGSGIEPHGASDPFVARLNADPAPTPGRGRRGLDEPPTDPTALKAAIAARDAREVATAGGGPLVVDGPRSFPAASAEVSAARAASVAARKAAATRWRSALAASWAAAALQAAVATRRTASGWSRRTAAGEAAVLAAGVGVRYGLGFIVRAIMRSLHL